MTETIITAGQVRKIAGLTKLTLTEQEVELFARLFSETLKTINVLDELDTKNVPETYQVTGLTNIFQKDKENRVTLTADEALSNAKEKVKGLFATEAVFDRQ